MKRMIPPDEALDMVMELTRPHLPQVTDITQASGLILAEDVLSDRDYPPFDRAMMDGFAVRVADGGKRAQIIGVLPAGRSSDIKLEDGYAAEIMTGAACPVGTQAVVPVELTQASETHVELPRDIALGMHISPRGSECERDKGILKKGDEITPLALAILATLGRNQVKTLLPPTMAIIATGDELVPTSASPQGHQIRNSNGPMLAAMATQIKIRDIRLFHARDTMESLRQALEQAAKSDIVLLSGGVSMGRYDLVPKALAAMDVQIVFHKVTQKPGKPLLFATKSGSHIFGIPGNPLSCHLCFHRYVTLVVQKMMGFNTRPNVHSGKLVTSLTWQSKRTGFILAKATNSQRQGITWSITPQIGQGSADIFAAHQANCYLRIAAGHKQLEPEETVEFEWIGSNRCLP